MSDSQRSVSEAEFESMVEQIDRYVDLILESVERETVDSDTQE